jgi:UDP-N-acetylmuramoyl-L-alanyl-D-glutamate--2,6-diaminopimelate ligase
MHLNDLLAALPASTIAGETNIHITLVAFDSRKVTKDCLFVAVKGVHTDGHQFITQAIARGAAAVVAESFDAEHTGATLITVKDSAAALGVLAARFYGNPSDQLTLVGVTGTNGKTTTATLLYGLFTNLGYKCGLLSTIENKIDQVVYPSHYTTPDPVAINQLLAEMVNAGCTYAFMEVSSHAIEQQRIAGLQFAGAVFTNITHDHLDYHLTFDNYIRAKKKLFDSLDEQAFALVNLDDKRGMVMLQNTTARKYTYGLKAMADFKAKILENTLEGLQLALDGLEFHALLSGEFNAYNLLAVYATGILLGQDKTAVMTALSELSPAEGRFEVITDNIRNVTAIVDYAHTPDALEKVLHNIQRLHSGFGGRIITVTGCGGDRDKTKRPEMARICAEMSDQAIFTADNPRSESVSAILEDMQAGVPKPAEGKVLMVADRRQAIRTACALANAGDIILVAGKGHEKYQEINGVRYPFDDKEELRIAFTTN